MNFEHLYIRSLTLPNNAGPNDPRLVLGPDIPALLVSTYAAFGTVTAVILAYSSATQYQFRAYITITATTQEITIEGWVDAGVVHEMVAYYYDPASGIPRTFFIGDVFTTSTKGVSVDIAGVAGGSLDPTSTTVSNLILGASVDFQIGGITQGRGLAGQAVATGNSAAIGAAETVILTTAAITWRSTRAYEVILSAWQTATLAGFSLYRLRQTNVGGQLIGSMGQWANSTTNAVSTEARQIIKRTAATDLSATLALSVFSSAGNMTQNGSADHPRGIYVYDIGAASDYPSALTIT